MTATAMASAFQRAEFRKLLGDKDFGEMYALACASLRETRNVETSINRTISRVASERNLLRAVMRFFYVCAEADMAGTPLPFPNAAVTGGQNSGEAQTSGVPVAAAAHSGGSHEAIETQCTHAPLPEPLSPPDGRSVGDTQRSVASPVAKPLAERGGQITAETHYAYAPVARQPARHGFKPISQIDRNAAAASYRLLNNALDSIYVRDGRRLRAVPLRDLDSLVAENTREAKLLERIKTYAKERYANAFDESKTVGDVIKAKDLDAWLDEINTEMRHAA